VNPASKDPASTVSARAPRPLGPYPHARRVGNLLFLSGIGPRHPQTERIPEGIEAQTRACIENVRTILEDAGSSLERVVDVTAFLTDIARDFAAFNRVYGEFFGEIRPTRTTVGVVALPVPISVELKVIAEG
jgi:2-aminomuconate deaminase